MKTTLYFLTLILAISLNAQTYNANEDTFVKGGTNSMTNYDDDIDLEIKTGTNADYFRRVLLKFDLSAEDIDHANVQSATLRLYANKAGDCDISASEVNDNWAANTVTWDTAPVSGNLIKTTFISAKDVFYEWDITSYAKSELSGDKIISLCLEDLGASNEQIEFNSNFDGSNIAELVLNLSSLSTSDFEAEKNAISVYPNPATDVLNVNVTNGELKNLTIFDVSGNSLYTNHGVKNNSQINISTLNEGIYLIRAETENSTQTLKFIK